MSAFNLDLARATRLNLLACVAALAACGGGGGGPAATESAPIVTSTPTPAPAPAPTPAPAPGPAPAPAPTSGGDAPATPDNAGTVGRARALSASASLSLDGVPDLPAAAAALAASPGRTYFVDSRNGLDTNDGLSDANGTSGHGPWRTLARVMTASLAAGDMLQLACGSEWNETLRLPASGTAARPITVGLPAAGCSVRPVIDGSVVLAASAWTQHQGMVYKTALSTPVLQLTSATSTVWTEAHHPNRGYKPSEPGSLYLATAADSPTVAGQAGSSTLLAGADLQLPAGATLGAGTRARIRIYPWTMQEVPLASATGRSLALARPTNYPLGAGWGYYLLGQQWMVDSVGEWFQDATLGQLYVQMPDTGVPTTALRATVLATGIDLRDRAYIVIDGLAVRRVGLGADLRGNTGSTLRNLRLDDMSERGVDATTSTGLTVESCAFNRTGADTISGWRHDMGPSAGLAVRNNVIRDSGVLMQGDDVVSLPRFSYAAIYGGPGSSVSGNTVVNAGYIGIQVMAGSLVEKNFVFGACSVLDDCAGIYTQTSSGSVIRGNTVVHSRGALAGKSPQFNYTQAQGIYLDESVSNALVEDNTVIDADNGIQVHDSSNNTVRGNRLYGNRRSQIWLQETRNRDNPAGDLVGNVIGGNQIAAVSGTSLGIWIDTIMPSSAHIGTIDGNRYFDRASPVVVRESNASGWRDFTLAQWQQAANAGLPAGRDANGSSTSATGYAAFSVTGGNVVPNTAFAIDTAGWSAWNQIAPLGQLVREACPAGMCLRYVAGGSSGLVSSPNFSVRQGQWYRMSVDLSTEQDAQTVRMVLRRGGGGANGYESLSDRELSLSAGKAWRRYTIVFQATLTVNAQDPITGDLGARIDIEPIESGRTVRLANLELVPLARDTVAGLTSMLINVGFTARSWDCPLTDGQAAGCSRMRRFADDQPLAWPASVPAFSALIGYAQEPTLRDSDGDGIADSQDDCAGTPAGAEVNARGCPLTLR